MNPRLTRQELLRRGAAGGALLAFPSLLAACGGGGDGGAEDQLKTVLNFANWPLYIDIDEKTKRSRSMPFPCESGPWTLAKYSALSLISSK